MQTAIKHKHTILATSYKLNKQHTQFVPALVLGVNPTGVTQSLHTSLSGLRPLALYLRNATELQYSTIVDIAATDKLLTRGRFTITYHFLSTITNHRTALQLFVGETTTIPSLAAPFANRQKLFSGAS